MATYFDPAVYDPPTGTLLIAEATCRCGHVNSWCCVPTSSTRTHRLESEAVYQVVPARENCEHSWLRGAHFTRPEFRDFMPGVQWATNE